jgi:hypothetical protein
MHRLLVFISLFAVSGCASYSVASAEAPSDERAVDGLDSPMESAKQQAKRENGFGLDKAVLDNEGKPVTDEEVGRLLDWRVAFPKNARLALLEARAFREYYRCGSWGQPERTVEGSDWAARPATPEDVKAVKEDLLASHLFESVSTVPAIFLPARADLGRCRYAAARANADLVLIYAKATREIRYHNRAANFYPLIIGLLLPGEETVVVTRVEGALVDARTGRVFAVAQGSSRGQDSSSPLASSDEGRRILLDGTEREALVELARNLKSELDAQASRDQQQK